MSRMNDKDLIDFGDVSAAVNDILQEGVLLYRHDRAAADARFRAAADARFRAALELDPAALPSYFCLYKIHTYQGRLDDALVVAQAGLSEASRQAKISSDWQTWTR